MQRVLYQVLNPQCACLEIVRQIQALFGLHNKGPVSENSSAYSQARGRLPLDILSRLRVAAAGHAQKFSQLWLGLCVKVIDGTTTRLPDTLKNQRVYPQSEAQKPGCGFPLLKLVGVFSLATGVLLDYAKGNKHQHELNLLQRLLDQFKPGDLALADRGFSSYCLMALLLLRKVQCLFGLHQARPWSTTNVFPHRLDSWFLLPSPGRCLSRMLPKTRGNEWKLSAKGHGRKSSKQ